MVALEAGWRLMEEMANMCCVVWEAIVMIMAAAASQEMATKCGSSADKGWWQQVWK